MTMDGNCKKKKDKFIVGDLVVIKFSEDIDVDDAQGHAETKTMDVPYIYRVYDVPTQHKDMNSQTDMITCELMEQRSWNNRNDCFCTTGYHSESFSCDQISIIEEDLYEVMAGTLTRKKRPSKSKDLFHTVLHLKCELTLEALYAPENDAADDVNKTYHDGILMQDKLEDGDDDIKGRVIVDSLKSVFSFSPSCQNSKSLVWKLIDRRGGILLMSPKYHAECAGVGIENCFGRIKWFFKANHTHTMAGLTEGSRRCFEKDVVTLHLCRKFARKSRDYMRAYRSGSRKLAVDSDIKIVKTHRSALDTDTAFVAQKCTEENVVYVYNN